MRHNPSQSEFRSRIVCALLCAVILYPAALLSGCGGGSSGSTAPPPVPDFSLALNPTSISITPGGTAQALLSLTPLNGFSSSVSVQLSGLPAGVTASAPTYTVNAGSPQTVILTAASNVAATTTTAVLTGTSASLTHTANLTVQIASPPPDFSIGLNPASIAIAPGGTAQTAVSLTALNGFSSSVSVQISGLPAGVTASSSEFTLTAGSPQTLTFSAASGAEATTAGVAFTGTSGSLTHTINLGVQVYARPFPGDLFMRLPGAEIGRPTLAGAYDEVLKEVFYSDANANTVEVYSTVDGHKVGEVSIPSPAGLEFSADFSKLYVGTITPSVYVVDPVALQVEQQIVVPLSLTTPIDPSFGTEMPVMPYAMADGSVLMGMGETLESSSTASLVQVFDLVRYDPVARTFTLANPGPSNLASNPARSSDGKYLFVYGYASNGYGLELYSAATKSYLPVFGQVQNAAVLAANQDGSQYATVQELALYGSGNAQINFWGANLQPQPQSYTVNAAVSAAIYSRDGKYLYLPTNAGYIVVLDTQAGTPAGYLGFSLAGLFFATLFDVDEDYHLYGGASGGAYILNASQTSATPPTAVPDFPTPDGSANPNVGPLAGGTQVQFAPAPTGAGSGDGIAGSMEAYFGTTPAPQDTVGPYSSSSNGENFLTATAPATMTPGPVSVLLTDANNNVVFLPDAFTYGPKILRVQPSAAGPAGGDSITIFAYGLGFFDLSDIHVTIGGTAVDMKNATLNSYVSNTFPEASVTISVPPGTPGWADVQITTSNGTDTLKRGLQYLSAETEITGGPFAFAVYDAVRSLFYLTGNGNTVSVFNASSQSMGKALTSSSISSGATLQQETITPDSSKLLVVDPTDQAIIVFDLVGGTSTKVSVVLPSDPANNPAQPINVVASANGRAFVGVTPCFSLPLREINLANMTVQGRTDLTSSCGYTPYPEYGAASADGSTILYAGSSGSQFGLSPSGPEYVWSYNASADAFTGPVIFNDYPWMSGLEPVLDGDGGVVGIPQGILDAQRLPKVNILSTGAIAEMNGTGSLLYGLGYEGSLIVLSDTHNGRGLLMLQAQNTPGTVIVGYQPLAIDATGTKILLGLQNGLAYFDLDVVPLAVGTVTPVSAAPGATIQVRGSGFVAGTIVKIGGVSANCSFVDAETLSCAVPALRSGAASMALNNPDGQTYSFENALVVP
jgi:hypothetical protein